MSYRGQQPASIHNIATNNHKELRQAVDYFFERVRVPDDADLAIRAKTLRCELNQAVDSSGFTILSRLQCDIDAVEGLLENGCKSDFRKSSFREYVLLLKIIVAESESDRSNAINELYDRGDGSDQRARFSVQGLRTESNERLRISKVIEQLMLQETGGNGPTPWVTELSSEAIEDRKRRYGVYPIALPVQCLGNLAKPWRYRFGSTPATQFNHKGFEPPVVNPDPVQVELFEKRWTQAGLGEFKSIEAATTKIAKALAFGNVEVPVNNKPVVVRFVDQALGLNWMVAFVVYVSLQREKPQEPTQVAKGDDGRGGTLEQREPVHSDDFRSVNWFGTSYSFTANQAPVVRMLWENWDRGTPEVGNETLLMAVDPEAPPDKIPTLFRNSDAYGEMIRPGATKGTTRLVAPEKKGSATQSQR